MACEQNVNQRRPQPEFTRLRYPCVRCVKCCEARARHSPRLLIRVRRTKLCDFISPCRLPASRFTVFFTVQVQWELSTHFGLICNGPSLAVWTSRQAPVDIVDKTLCFSERPQTMRTTRSGTAAKTQPKASQISPARETFHPPTTIKICH